MTIEGDVETAVAAVEAADVADTLTQAQRYTMRAIWKRLSRALGV